MQIRHEAELVIERLVLLALAKRHVYEHAGALRRGGGVRIYRAIARAADRGDEPERTTLGMRGQDGVNFSEASIDAGRFARTVLLHRQVVFDLGAKALTRLAHLIAPVEPLDRLFRPKRNQHADDDGADLLQELARAMPWLRFVDFQYAALSDQPSL